MAFFEETAVCADDASTRSSLHCCSIPPGQCFITDNVSSCLLYLRYKNLLLPTFFQLPLYSNQRLFNHAVYLVVPFPIYIGTPPCLSWNSLSCIWPANLTCKYAKGTVDQGTRSSKPGKNLSICSSLGLLHYRTDSGLELTWTLRFLVASDP